MSFCIHSTAKQKDFGNLAFRSLFVFGNTLLQVLLCQFPCGRKRQRGGKQFDDVANHKGDESRGNGFALDMSMGGPDADDADFRESA